MLYLELDQDEIRKSYSNISPSSTRKHLLTSNLALFLYAAHCDIVHIVHNEEDD